MNQIGAILDRIRVVPPWAAKSERHRLSAAIADFDGYRFVLSSHRVDRNGDMLRSTLRHAAADFSVVGSERWGRAEWVNRVIAVCNSLALLVFPRPLPTFRIRRDARRLTSRAA